MTSPFGFTAKTDGVDDHLAAHVNALQLAADVMVKAPAGHLYNGRISVSVSSSDLTVAIKTVDNADPSASDPVYFRIGNTVRSLTSALSVTKADGTNWCNAGGAELAGKEIDYFVYLIWNTVPTPDEMSIGFSRYPNARIGSDFSATTTNEKHLAQSNAAGFSAADDCVLIGRFAATLSAAAGHLWTVPAFTTSNLIQEPIYRTRDLNWQPVYSASGSMTFTSVTTTIAKYMVDGNQNKAWARGDGTTGGTASTTLQMTLPWESIHMATATEVGTGSTTDAAVSSARVFITAGTPDMLSVTKSDGSNYALAAGKIFNVQINYSI